MFGTESAKHARFTVRHERALSWILVLCAVAVVVIALLLPAFQ